MHKTEANFFYKINTIYSTIVLSFLPITSIILLFCFFNYKKDEFVLYPLMKLKDTVGVNNYYMLLIILFLFTGLCFILIYKNYSEKILFKRKWFFDGNMLISPSLKEKIEYTNIKQVIFGLDSVYKNKFIFPINKRILENAIIIILDNSFIVLNLILNKNGKKFIIELKRWMQKKVKEETKINIKKYLLKGNRIRWNILLPISDSV